MKLKFLINLLLSLIFFIVVSQFFWPECGRYCVYTNECRNEEILTSFLIFIFSIIFYFVIKNLSKYNKLIEDFENEK